MLRRFAVFGAIGVILALAIVMGGGSRSTSAFVAPGIQDFDLDVVHCLIPAYPDTLTPDPLAPAGPPQWCAAGEAKGAGGPTAGFSTGIALGAGNRLGYPYVYAGPGWVLQNDAAIPDGTVVGDVVSATDLIQDGTVDIMADDSNCGGPPNNCGSPIGLAPPTVPEAYVEQTTAWGAGTGCTGEDESYLTEAMPGVSAMARYVRYRACIDTLYLGGVTRFDLVQATGSPTPLNLVTLTPNWSPAGTTVNLVLLAGAANSPTAGSVVSAIDSPQASLSHTDAPYADNPAAPGLYARWSTELSAADEADRALNVVLATNCKAIGGAVVDADADCLVDTDPNDTDGGTNIDRDGDFLPDGIEIAWGSNPDLADTDGDGRTDFEEMIGPSQMLSDPTVADTDGDTVPDGGYLVDANGDGAPDVPDEDGDGIADAGISANLDISGDGSSHVRIGARIVGWDIAADGAGNDNCPSIPNGGVWPAGQVNTDYDSTTEHGNGDIYGDACDTDDDQDEIVDGAELTFKWDIAAGACSNAAAPTGLLDPHNYDSDGDGVMDGTECHLNSNPADDESSPGKPAGAPLTDADQDGISDSFETFQRSQHFSDQPSGPVGNEDVDGDGFIGQNDPDSDNDGLSDGCEAMVTGTSLLSLDTDNDGTPDASEPSVIALAAANCSSATDLDGDTVTNEADNCLFVANPGQENTGLIGNGIGIPGDDKTVPWSAVNQLTNAQGDACDGDATYDDSGDGTWKGAGDDGTFWDANSDSIVDGDETACANAPGGTTDTDGDGLLDKWEVCKWATCPDATTVTATWDCTAVADPTNTDNEGGGDCNEAADVNGDGIVDFVGDTLAYARAALIPGWGKDGDFDINGDGLIDFVGDVLREAQYSLSVIACS